MKAEVSNQASGGLLVLMMLIIAFVASQAEPNFRQQAPAMHAFELDAGLTVTVDRRRLATLESLSSVSNTVLDLPIRVNLTIDENATPVSDIPDAENSPAHND